MLKKIGESLVVLLKEAKKLIRTLPFSVVESVFSFLKKVVKHEDFSNVVYGITSIVLLGCSVILAIGLYAILLML